MTIKNESILGLTPFIKQYHKDLLSGKAQGWWGERFGRRSERLNVKHEGNTYQTTYDFVEALRNAPTAFSEEFITKACEDIQKVHLTVDTQRSYLWEVDASVEEQEEPIQEEEIVEDDTSEQEDVQEEVSGEVVEEVESKPEPDFEYAKTIEDKQELKTYAKEFGFKLDSRKSLSDMMKSFQGKFHATKGKQVIAYGQEV